MDTSQLVAKLAPLAKNPPDRRLRRAEQEARIKVLLQSLDDEDLGIITELVGHLDDENGEVAANAAAQLQWMIANLDNSQTLAYGNEQPRWRPPGGAG
jgi:hypothetical protein